MGELLEKIENEHNKSLQEIEDCKKIITDLRTEIRSLQVDYEKSNREKEELQKKLSNINKALETIK